MTDVNFIPLKLILWTKLNFNTKSGTAVLEKYFIPCDQEVVTPIYTVTHYINWGNYFLDTQYIISSLFLLTMYIRPFYLHSGIMGSKKDCKLAVMTSYSCKSVYTSDVTTANFQSWLTLKSLGTLLVIDVLVFTCLSVKPLG